MKICIASEIFWPQPEGGAEISARLGAEALAKTHDVCVMSLGHPSATQAPIGETLSSAGYRVLRVPFNNAYLPSPIRQQRPRFTKALWHIRNFLGSVRISDLVALLENEAPDVIYVQNAMRMQPALFTAAKRLAIPIVMHVRDYGLVCPRASMFRNGTNCRTQCWDCRILSAPARRAASNIDHAIAVSAFVGHRIASHSALGAIDWSVMHNTNTPRDAIRCSPPTTGTKPFTFGYLGAISREKGVHDLVDAFARLPAGEATLVIGGSGDPRTVRDLQIHTAGQKIEWLGHVSPNEVYARADMIVVPSLWHEPQSRVLVEAAVRGIPLLASDRGGNREAVAAHQLGWIYDPDAQDALLSLMAKAIHQRNDWSAATERLFPGLGQFKGTAEDSRYYERLQAILTRAVSGRSR